MYLNMHRGPCPSLFEVESDETKTNVQQRMEKASVAGTTTTTTTNSIV